MAVQSGLACGVLRYAARIVGGELTDESGGSTDEARWFPLAELPRVSMVDTGLRLAGRHPVGD